LSLSFFLTTAAKKPRTECSCQPVAAMIAAMGVPSASRNIPSTISFFETLAPDDSADAGFVSGPSAGVLDAITLCFPDEGRVARDGLGFADFDWRLRAAI
jgi:hypothetical protein